jgi:sporulation protein YlmC with PRC-barrel domain
MAQKRDMPEIAEVRLEHLLGRRVLDRDGHPIGRIEEVRAEPQGRDLVVTEYLVGTSAMLERLSVEAFGLAALALLGVGGRRKRRGGYRVPWDRLDLEDADRPRLRCAVEELPRLEQGGGGG